MYKYFTYKASLFIHLQMILILAKLMSENKRLSQGQSYI